ncbi:MAG: sugar phosphate isomerase/epimerase [Chloroflexota bacterium]|nr:sugar phosphate isomerase/epimerase [Chloroflexota bacterium]
MKISFVISTQPTRFQAVAFDPNFESNLTRLATLGYDGVELAVREPAALDVRAVKRELDAHHLMVPAIGTGQAYVEEQLSFTDRRGSVRDQAVQRIESHIALASEFNALVILGLIRGKVQPGVSADQARAWMIEALKQVARAAASQRVRLAIEPINRYETNLLNTVGETAALIDEMGVDNVGILFDTFHSNIEEPQIEASLRACGARLFHVHLADSNRWYPGAGHIDFARVVATLREMNYAGWVSAEILPKPDVMHAAEQTIRTIKPLL